ncbi:MAG: toprim domain-containing protein [Planctomycetota bacterium]
MSYHSQKTEWFDCRRSGADRREDHQESQSSELQRSQASGDRPEILIVEGDSASRSVVRSRDADFQAVFSMQGKPMNAVKASPASTRRNVLFQRLVEVMGGGWGDAFDLDSLAYDQVLLLFDPDADGIHIGVLMTLFFDRWMPGLIESGKLIVVRPPLFELWHARSGPGESRAESDTLQPTHKTGPPNTGSSEMDSRSCELGDIAFRDTLSHNTKPPDPSPPQTESTTGSKCVVPEADRATPPPPSAERIRGVHERPNRPGPPMESAGGANLSGNPGVHDSLPGQGCWPELEAWSQGESWFAFTEEDLRKKKNALLGSGRTEIHQRRFRGLASLPESILTASCLAPSTRRADTIMTEDVATMKRIFRS